MTKCYMTDADGNRVDSCVMCGLRLTPCTLREVETISGEVYTVQILECEKCGTPCFGWVREK